MAKSKWERFVIAHRLVRRLRQEYDIKSCEFKCFDKVVVPDMVDSLYADDIPGVVFVDGDVADCICDLYKEHDVCVHTGCPKYSWNKQYVDLANKLSNAKAKRKQAFLNLVNIRKK